MEMLPYGAFVLTSGRDDNINGMLLTWITQVSFVPRRLAVGLQKTSYSYGLVQSGQSFVINFFSKAETNAINPFKQSKQRNPQKLVGIESTPAPETGCPVLANSAAYLECRVLQIIDVGGDHDVVIAEPIGAGIVNKPRKSGAKDILTLVDVSLSYGG
jgi:flavin reductase (DIM6/NTAB) family NADH-FMN oxidoreductase RutF